MCVRIQRYLRVFPGEPRPALLLRGPHLLCDDGAGAALVQQLQPRLLLVAVQDDALYVQVVDQSLREVHAQELRSSVVPPYNQLSDIYTQYLQYLQ